MTTTSLLRGAAFTAAVALGLGCATDAARRGPSTVTPGQRVALEAVANLRDLGGYATADGATVAPGLVYRSDKLSALPPGDRERLAALGLKVDFDLRTEAERAARPDDVPPGVTYVWLDVMADASHSGAANLEALMADPPKANEVLGGGRAEADFAQGYRQFVSLPSARKAFGQLFRALGDRAQLPALFHCTTGKDRTGWAAAALLTLLGVPRDAVMADYLRSNDYILPAYQVAIDRFVAAGGDPAIPPAILGVKAAYLEASFDELARTYGTIEKYFEDGLGIGPDEQAALRALYLRPGS